MSDYYFIVCKKSIKINNFNNFINEKGYSLAEKFNQIIIKCFEKHNSERILNFLFNLYEQLNVNPNFNKIVVFFLFHSLVFQGIQFNLSSCVNCNQTVNLFSINYSLGGIFCRNCTLESSIKKINIVIFKSLYQLYYLNYQDINKWKVSLIEITKITQILENHQQTYIAFIHNFKCL